MLRFEQTISCCNYKVYAHDVCPLGEVIINGDNSYFRGGDENKIIYPSEMKEIISFIESKTKKQ